MIDNPRPIDKYTRILYYTHVQRQETFPGDQEKTKNCFKRALPRTSTTHIIAGITYGIHVGIIPQLPAAPMVADHIDRVFKIIPSFFKRS